jgi:hypothetical protein
MFYILSKFRQLVDWKAPSIPQGGSFHFGNKKSFMFLSIILAKEKFKKTKRNLLCD